MNYIDVGMSLLVGLSVLLAFWKGFVEQLLSLVGWVAAFLASTRLGEQVAPMFAQWVVDPSVQLVVAYVVIALVVWLASKVVSKALGTLVQKIGLGQLDRLLGVLFGAIRGVVLVVLLVAIASLTDLRFHSEWETSQLMPYAEMLRDHTAARLDDYLSK